ncbi:MAG: hypothetical protein Q9186_000111 [Xanthomendoza sp. 1 TL-2023]
MVVVLPQGSLANILHHGITHFLRIPFATAKSTVQLQDSIERVATDPIAAELPRAAWNAPDEVHFQVSPLSLKTPSRVRAATQLLRDIQLMYTPIRNQGSVESVPFLWTFRSLVLEHFLTTDLVPVVTSQTDRLGVNIMATRYLSTDIPVQKPTLRGRGFRRRPSFDASDLFQKYQHFEWTGQFGLERLCISELGLKDFSKDGQVVRTGYRDIASVPLPGVSSGLVAELLKERSNEEYSRAYKSISKNQPRYPLLIPSTRPA